MTKEEKGSINPVRIITPEDLTDEEVEAIVGVTCQMRNERRSHREQR